MRATVLQLAIPTIEHRDAVRVRVFTLLVLMALTGVTKKRMEDSVRKVSEPAYNRIARHNVLTVLVTTMAIREGISLDRAAITSMPSKEAIVLVPTTIAMRVKVVISPVKVAMVSVLSRAIVPVPTSMREKVATSLVSKVAMVSSVVAMVSSEQRGGYGQQRGGYGQQRGGYGQQRGGYGQQRGGYGQQRGGYDPNAKYSLKKRIEYKEVNVDPNEPIRLNKFLANAGICSRREADEFILSGAVTVNGQVVTELGTKVLRTDEVVFHGAPVSLEKKVYVLLNKPKDYVTTSDDPQQRKTVMDLVKNVCPERIYPVGRLDRNTTGVLLLTNDGDLASKLTHPKFLKKKVYHVFLDKNVDPQDMERIKEGIDLEDGEVHADAIEYCNENDKSQVGVEIHSGKNRIVRRIFESLGYRVVKLDRVQFAGLTKKNLRRGDWRFLTEKEVEMLRMGAFE